MAKDVNLDRAEIARFEAHAADWWNPDGRFRPVHAFNAARVAYLADALPRVLARDPTAPQPLRGLRLLDVGAGGGLVAEPMARLGARVVGLDPAPANVGAARLHAAASDLAIDYRAGSLEAVTKGERFDIVLCLEVVEHVPDARALIDGCIARLAPGGVLAVATINRTLASLLLAKVGAEYVLGWLPRGTHDWRRFVRPEALAGWVLAKGLRVEEVVGFAYDPLRRRWRPGPGTGVNYLLLARRRA